jgi:hypothetical protein
VSDASGTESPERAGGFSWKDAKIRASEPRSLIDGSVAVGDAPDDTANVDSWRRVPHARPRYEEGNFEVAEEDTERSPMKLQRKQGCACGWCLMYARLFLA